MIAQHMSIGFDDKNAVEEAKLPCDAQVNEDVLMHVFIEDGDILES